MITLTRTHKRTIVGLILTLTVGGVLTFVFTSPLSPLSGLHNDLKGVVPPESQSYTDLDGNPVDLQTFAGKPLIINSWATWMPFSKDELPELGVAQGTYGDAVKIIAINRMEDRAVVRSYLATYGISESNILILIDPADTFYKSIGGYAMPETAVYSFDGTLVNHIRGVFVKDELYVLIDSIAKNSPK